MSHVRTDSFESIRIATWSSMEFDRRGSSLDSSVGKVAIVPVSLGDDLFFCRSRLASKREKNFARKRILCTSI